MITEEIKPIEGFDIEFKKIEVDEFNSDFYHVEKEVIEVVDGYISNDLARILQADMFVKNTIVINSGTGQGKTKSVLEIIKKYTETPDYIVIIAVPSKNLIEQYVNVTSPK